MRTTAIKSSVLLVAATAVQGNGGGIRGRDWPEEAVSNNYGNPAISGSKVGTNGQKARNEQQQRPRILGDGGGGGSSRSKPVMFVLRDGDKQGHYCLTYENPYVSGSNLVLVASRCDARNKKQQWVVDTKAKHGEALSTIKSKKESNMCVEYTTEGAYNARLMECDGDSKDQKMTISGDGAIQKVVEHDKGGELRSIGIRYRMCREDEITLSFDRGSQNALWDMIRPDDYKEPSESFSGNINGGDRVLVVSEYDSTKCVGDNLELMDCNKDGKDMIWHTNWFNGGKNIWNPTSGRVYEYSWNRGIARDVCCLSHMEYWSDNEHFGPLFEFYDQCESHDVGMGFLLIPVDQYKGPPRKPKDVSLDDYVQLQVHSNTCLQAKDWDNTELEVTKCNTEQYDIEDEQLWYIDGSLSEGSFKLRSKIDLTMCLDFGVYEAWWDRDGDGYKVPRLARCDESSSRQEWRYSKKNNNEISHVKVPGYMGRTFCLDTEKTCTDDSCEETDWYDWDHKLRIAGCDGTADQSWKVIKNDKCSRDEAPRVKYPKHDYFLFVSKEDPGSCWERDVTENMGLLLGMCHMTIPRRHNSEIFYFEPVEEADESVRIKMRMYDQRYCMSARKGKIEAGTCIDMHRVCDSSNTNQEWLYDTQSGEISPAGNEELCVSSNCADTCNWMDCEGGDDCGDFCLKKCNGKGNQAFDTMSVSDYRMEYDYGKGIDKDDIFMIVLRENPKFCAKAYDSLELQDIVVSKCKIDNAEEHWTFEEEKKGTRWRSVENPHVFVESVQNTVGKKLITNEDMISKNKQHWTFKDDGTIRPAEKNKLCVTRDTCGSGSPGKNDNLELAECNSKNERMKFDLVRPSEYNKFVRNAAVAYSRNNGK